MIDFYSTIMDGEYNHLAQSVSELPISFIGSKDIIVDFETTSGDPEKESTNPHHDCSIAGYSVTTPDCMHAYYIDYRRLPAEQKQPALQYLQDLVWHAERWINQSVKYDVHVYLNAGLQLPPYIEFICTIVRAKLIDSDRGGARGGYSLDTLCEAWLQKDIRPYENALKPFLRNNKDYGPIPSDIIAPYGCEDGQAVKQLITYINGRLPERSQAVADTEMRLTKELVKLEQFGMHFDPLKLKIEQIKLINRLYEIDNELTELVGRSFRPHVNEDCNEVLCGQYGLPIVAYTKDTDNASFDKKALAQYKADPFAPQDVIDRIIEYRKLHQRNSLLVNPWRIKAPLGVCRPNFNQVVRTGRMSCSDPNAQQLDEFMAELIIPRPGNSIISTDASQIEYRMIVDYIGNLRCIKAYNDNPDTDFHDLVAKMVAEICNAEIGRSPAKTLNFQHGFGAGKKAVIKAVASNPSIVKAIKAKVDALGIKSTEGQRLEFDRIAVEMGTMIYNAYHANLPELKPTAKQAEETVKLPNRRLGSAPSPVGSDIPHYYGYITNKYGRDRHLPYAAYRHDFKTKDPYDMAWLAFPTINSSSAADLMKERFVCLMREGVQELPIWPICMVHDELVFEAPTALANDPRLERDIVAVLESPAIELSIPIRWSIGVSDRNWLHASLGVDKGGKSRMIQYNKCDAENLDWARKEGW